MQSNVSGSGVRQLFNEDDARTRIVKLEQKRDAELALKKREEDMRNGIVPIAEQRPDNAGMPWEIMMYVLGAFALIIGLSLGVIYIILRVVGDGLE